MADGDEFTVNPDHLTSDANRWDDIAAVITEAVTLAGTSTELPRYAMDGLSVAAGLKDAYDAEQDALVTYLNEGKQYIASIGATLRIIRDAYTASDERAVDHLKSAANDD